MGSCSNQMAVLWCNFKNLTMNHFKMSVLFSGADKESQAWKPVCVKISTLQCLSSVSLSFSSQHPVLTAAWAAFSIIKWGTVENGTSGAITEKNVSSSSVCNCCSPLAEKNVCRIIMELLRLACIWCPVESFHIAQTSVCLKGEHPDHLGGGEEDAAPTEATNRFRSITVIH